MNKLLFTILATIALTVGALAQSANPTNPTYPIYNTGSVSLSGIPTTAAGTTTTVTNGWIDVRGMQYVTLQTVFAFSGSTTSNAVYTVSKSIDKVNAETTGTTWTVAGNGTTPVVATTTITTGSAGWLKLASIQNTHGSLVLTNTSFIYGIKRNSP